MRILLLGGIGEASELARALAPAHAVSYSVAGKGRMPELPCPVRVGGFGGAEGLAEFLRGNGFELLIDATHPYAAQISRNAAQAAQLADIPLWAYRRPAWPAQPGDDWRPVPNWAAMMQALQPFRRPFFTIGLEPLYHVAAIPPEQHWLVRCLAAAPPLCPRVTLLHATGPFELDRELALLRYYRIDVLVAKNSGGTAVEAKLAAARQQGIPVIMLARPALPQACREFTDVRTLSAALLAGASESATAQESPRR